MHAPTPTIWFDDVSFGWPDGTQILEPTTIAFGVGRTGLIGDNGAGKTTLLRLIAQELRPSVGTVTTRGDVGYLPQNLTLATDARAADLLGLGARLDALRAIEGGDVSPSLFDTIGDDWDVEARALAELHALGLGALGLERPVGSLSGGETMLVALAGLRLARTPIVLLDEPTNNLDRTARARLRDAITAWQGALVVVSHDVALLDLMDDTAELHGRTLTVHGGGYTEFAESLAAEQASAVQALRGAEQALRRERRQRREAETKLARRKRYADSDYANKRKPKIIMNQRRSEAQVSAGKLRDGLDARVEVAGAAVEAERSRVRDDATVRIELPPLVVPAGRRLLELHHTGGVQVIVGPERVALVGANGIGKTRLLETLFDPSIREGRPVFGVHLTPAIGYLPQRLDGLDDGSSAVENVRMSAPGTPAQVVRGQLARFLLRGDDADRAVGTLSGGERFRVALARLLLADPPYQMLVLDEPTNNLDLSTVEALVDGLSAYRGALLVVSHDDHLLDRLALSTIWELDAAGRLGHIS